MKLWKMLGGLLVFLGCLAALTGILATAAPLIDNDQVRRILESFAIPSQDPLLSAVNRVILFCLQNNYMLFGVGAAVLLIGGLMKTAASKAQHRAAPADSAPRGMPAPAKASAPAQPVTPYTAVKPNAGVSPYIAAEYSAAQPAVKSGEAAQDIASKYLPHSIVATPDEPVKPKTAHTPDVMSQRDLIARKTAELYGDGTLFTSGGTTATGATGATGATNAAEGDRVLCKACGASNTPHSAFCDQCGSRLPVAAAPLIAMHAQASQPAYGVAQATQTAPAPATQVHYLQAQATEAQEISALAANPATGDETSAGNLQARARQAMAQVRATQTETDARQASQPANDANTPRVQQNQPPQPAAASVANYVHFHAPAADEAHADSVTAYLTATAPEAPFAREPVAPLWGSLDVDSPAKPYDTPNVPSPERIPAAATPTAPAAPAAVAQAMPHTGNVRRPRVISTINRGINVPQSTAEPDLAGAAPTAYGTPAPAAVATVYAATAYATAEASSAPMDATSAEAVWAGNAVQVNAPKAGGTLNQQVPEAMNTAYGMAAFTPVFDSEVPANTQMPAPVAQATQTAPMTQTAPAAPATATQTAAKPRIVSTMGKKSTR